MGYHFFLINILLYFAFFYNGHFSQSSPALLYILHNQTDKFFIFCPFFAPFYEKHSFYAPIQSPFTAAEIAESFCSASAGEVPLTCKYTFIFGSVPLGRINTR